MVMRWCECFGLEPFDNDGISMHTPFNIQCLCNNTCDETATRFVRIQTHMQTHRQTRITNTNVKMKHNRIFEHGSKYSLWPSTGFIPTMFVLIFSRKNLFDEAAMARWASLYMEYLRDSIPKCLRWNCMYGNHAGIDSFQLHAIHAIWTEIDPGDGFAADEFFV